MLSSILHLHDLTVGPESYKYLSTLHLVQRTLIMGLPFGEIAASLQVYDNVETVMTPLTAQEKKVLNEVLNILAPVHNTTWPSGRPENN